MSAGFQQQVYNQPVQAVAGDFASLNPYFTFNAGPGGLVAGAAGCTVGLFAWAINPDDPNGGPTLASNTGIGAPTGFVHRALQGLNTTFLSDASMLIPQGLHVTLMTGGDFWVINNGTAQALIGQKAFAITANGKAAFANAGTVYGGASATGSSIAASTFSVTG